MNDTFNLKRFGWVFKKSVLERPAVMLGSLLVCLLITLLTYATIKSSSGVVKAQLISFVVGFLLGGSFMSSSVFGYFATPFSGSSYLMLPASHFEKWLCGVLIAIVIYPAIYLGFYRVIDILFVNSYHNSLDTNSPGYQSMYHAVEVFTFDNMIAVQIFIVFANISACMLIGSLYFNKVGYIKTTLLLCALIMSAYFLNRFIAGLFFDHIDLAMPFKSIFLKVGTELGIIDLPDGVNKFFTLIITYVLPAMLLLTAFIRLKEKEV